MYVIEIRKGEERAASEFFGGYDSFNGEDYCIVTRVPVAWAHKFASPVDSIDTSFAARVLSDCKAAYPDCDVRFVDAVTTQPV